MTNTPTLQCYNCSHNCVGMCVHHNLNVQQQGNLCKSGISKATVKAIKNCVYNKKVYNVLIRRATNKYVQDSNFPFKMFIFKNSKEYKPVIIYF